MLGEFKCNLIKQDLKIYMHDSLKKGKDIWGIFFTLTSLVAFNEITLNIWYDGTTQVAQESFRAR